MFFEDLPMSYSDGFTAAADAVLDDAHGGDIHGAFGTIRRHDVGPRSGWGARLRTLLAILGPGLIVMVGDNDAGAFGTYAQAGQNYGTTLLWTLLLLVPVLYVNQEMVLRLGAVTRVGHARLILKRYGKFWGAFSVIDLFVLNALTLVTEFIGISLALSYLGVSRPLGVLAAAAVVVAAAGTGDFRRFERFSLLLVLGSLLLIPLLLWAHPPVGQMAHDFVVPHLPQGRLSEIMLLIIAVVGTTVAPWQLFFQQSYVIDKRITPRFMRYERIDLCLGIGLVVLGAVAMIGFTAATFAGHPEFGAFQDAGAVAEGLGKYVGCVLRGGSHRCQRDWRNVRIAIDGLRHRRCALAASLAASPSEGSEDLLCGVWGTDCAGGGTRADAGHAPGPPHQCGADAGRCAAAERDRLSAAALQ
jgi:hypothetical protein